MTRRHSRLVLLVLALAAAGCRPGARGAEARAAADTTRDSVVRAQPPEPAILRTLVAVPVVGFTGPGGTPFEVGSRTSGSDARLHRQIGMKTFALPLRVGAPPLSQYPCSSCHQGSSITSRRADPRHANIVPGHPRYNEGACATCHTPGAVDRLRLPGAETATLDQSYRLCAQCHFAQATAWAGGGHGKRLVAWGARRVVMTCTDCHDPHKPAVQSRLPFPGPRIRQSSGASH